MRRPLLTGILVATLLSCATLLAKPPYPAPAPPKHKSRLGLGIQRTMTLLATSTPKQRHKVRILFYGQSITEQDWWKRVASDLRARFPHADLEIANRAIGGFAAQFLVRPAEHDLYPFYPDLLIFHVYGSNKEYAEIIRSTRSRTTAEVLLQTDHVTRWPPKVIDRDKDKGAWWDDFMNHTFLPTLARKYDCGLVPIRGPWLRYLTDNRLEPKALLSDGVHLNDQGNFLMAKLVERYLVHRPDLPKDSWQGLVRTLAVGKDVAWKDGKLVLEFEGNRLDALSARAPGKKAGSARVLIDGKKPSAFPGVYRITRPTPGPWSPLALTRVDHERPLQVEDWTLKVTSVAADAKSWEFAVSGARTGPDGSGSSGKPFLSKSGRVKIDPQAWFRHEKAPLAAGYEIRWRVLPLFADSFEPAEVREPAREYATTLAQGLSNGRHRLELDGEVPLKALRIYRPPVK